MPALTFPAIFSASCRNGQASSNLEPWQALNLKRALYLAALATDPNPIFQTFPTVSTSYLLHTLQ